MLKLRDFRCLGASTLLNSIGMMGELVVLGWLSLELTDSPFLVGATLGARALPLVFVGVPAGVLADRVARPRLLVATGLGRALVNGLAALGVAMRAGWLVGSLGVGALIAHLGSGHAYLAVAATYLAGGLAMLPAGAAAPIPASEAGSLWRGVTDFVTSVRDDRTLLILMTLTAGAEVLGFAHQALLPSLSRDVLHTGPEGLGVMSAARSVGGILSMMASIRGFTHGGGALFLGVLVSFGAGLIALGVAPFVVGFIGVAVVVVLANAAGAVADLLAQSLLQQSVPYHLRGRAGGAWVVAIGFAPLGQLQIGALASLLGVSAALGLSGFALVALAAVTAVVYPRVRAL